MTDLPGAVRAREAIVYVPGLAHGEARITVDAMATRLAGELDRRAVSRDARFRVAEAQVVEYRDEIQSRRVTIERQDADAVAVPVIDVFEFGYRESIRERYEQRAPIRQAITIAWLLIANSLRFFRFLLRRGKGAGDKLQLVIASAVLLLIVSYLAILLVTAVGTGVQVLRPATVATSPDGPDERGESPRARREGATEPEPELAAQLGGDGAEMPAPPGVPPVQGEAGAEGDAGDGADGDDLEAGLEHLSRKSATFDRVLDWLRSLVVLLTGIGLLARGSIKQVIEDLSIEYAAVINYVSSQTERTELIGRFLDLLEHIHESENRYERIDIISYSFGSVVAVDCVFGYAPPAPALAAVNTLTTVGSPFDIIRSFFPDYFSRRRHPGSRDLRWFNIYSPEDVLSSNFRDDEETGEAEEIGIEIDDRGLAGDGDAPRPPELVTPDNILYGPGTEEHKSWPWVRLVRLREIHMAYWGKSSRAVSFMSDYVPARYAAEDPLLR